MRVVPSLSLLTDLRAVASHEEIAYTIRMKSASTYLLKNCTAIATVNDTDDILYDADILVEGACITRVEKNCATPADEVIDCAGKVAFPGFVNVHHHLFQVLTRALPAAQDSTLFDWLVYHYEIWRWLTPERLYAAARAGLSELLLTGCTTSADHHYLFPARSSLELIDAEISAAREVGIRFNPTRGSMSRGHTKGGLPPDDVVQEEDAILADALRVIEAYHDPSPGAMCRIALAPCSPFSVTAELLRDTAALAREKGVMLHTHLCETLDEEEYCLNTCGMRPLAYMEEVGWIGDDVWLCHGIYFTDEEIQLLGATRTGIAHCPTSNLRLGSGVAPIRALWDAGCRVGIAVDGSASNDSSNMLQEVRMALLVSRIKAGVESMPVRSALRLATRGGADALGRADIGTIAPGMRADIALWDVASLPYVGAQEDPVAAVLMCGIDSRAWLTMVDGVIRVRDKTLVASDTEDIVCAARSASEGLLRDAGCSSRMI